MAKNKLSGLGKGLDAVFLENSAESSGSVSVLRIGEIQPNPDQPRKTFDDKALGELAVSIREHGLIQPITVKPSGIDGLYTIIAGERRWRASKLAGLDEVPVVVMDLDEKTAAQIALIENIQREDLSPVEEARAFKKLIEEHGLTQESLATKIGKSRPAITNSLRLLELPNEVLDMIEAGTLSSGHARTLLGLNDKEKITETAKIVEAESLSVRNTEALVKKINKVKKDKKGKEEDENNGVSVDYTSLLAQKMTSKLGRKINIDKKGQKGKITITFTSDSELDDIVTQLCGKNIFDD